MVFKLPHLNPKRMQFCNKRKLKPDPELILYKFTPIQIDVKNELKGTFSTREGETNKEIILMISLPLL